MPRSFLIGLLACAILFPLFAGAPPTANQSLAEILETFMVQRNGEVILDVRSSDPERWQREILQKTGPWHLARRAPNVFRFIVIHEYNRYHCIQLDRDQKVLSFLTTHVEETPLDASGPNWAKHVKESK